MFEQKETDSGSSGIRGRVTPAAVRDQQHSAVLPSADLLDDVEVFLDLQMGDALRRQLHQLVDGAAISKAQFNHLHGQGTGTQPDGRFH